MKMMKAAVVEKPNEMKIKQVPVPDIDDDEVLIKVKYCGICGTDWSIFTGKYASEKLPLISGHEFWGVIDKLGKNSKCLKIGDRVAVDICLPCGTCYFCRRGDFLLCQTFTQLGIHTNGAFAEYVKAPWKNCYHIPNEIDDYSAAFIEPLTTTIEASKRMNLKISSSIAIIGCGLGILHAVMAKLRGAAPIIVIGDNPHRLELAKEMAADYVIDINKTPDAAAEVMKITSAIGVDYVIEAVGTPRTYEQAFKMVRRGGKVEAFGICSSGDIAKLEPFEFVLGEKKVSGSCAGIGNDWEEAINLLQYKRINPSPMYSMVVPLEELEVALNELRSNQNLIKVFVSPEITERKILNL